MKLELLPHCTESASMRDHVQAGVIDDEMRLFHEGITIVRDVCSIELNSLHEKPLRA